MNRRHLAIFVLMLVTVAVIHASYDAWESRGNSQLSSATTPPAPTDDLCTACGPIKGAKPLSPTAGKKSEVPRVIDVSGLEPFEVDTPKKSLTSLTPSGFTPPPAARPSN